MQMPLWNDFHIKWIGTHIDRSKVLKILFVIIGFFQFCFLIPYYNIVHFHISTSSSAIRKYLFFRITKLLKRKIVVHLHLGIDQFRDQLKRQCDYRAYGVLFKGADAIIVLSKKNKEELNSLFEVGEKTNVIYNPCTIINNVSYTSDYKNILFAGTLNQRKGYSVLLKAFALIATKHPDWKLNFAGNGEIENASQIAHDLKIHEQVNFLGWIKGEEKEKIFRQASIFCLPSYSEGFPMAILDAFSYAIPVVITPVGGIPDVLADGENALLFEPGNSEQLANNLERLMNNDTLLKNMSEKSFKLTKGLFNPEHINYCLSSLYSHL